MTLTAKEYCKGILIDDMGTVYSHEHSADVIPRIVKDCKKFGIGKDDYSDFWELINEEYCYDPTILDSVKLDIYNSKGDYPIYELLELLEEEGYVDADTPIISGQKTVWDFLAGHLYNMVINDHNYCDMVAKSLWFEINLSKLLE